MYVLNEADRQNVKNSACYGRLKNCPHAHFCQLQHFWIDNSRFQSIGFGARSWFIIHYLLYSEILKTFFQLFKLRAVSFDFSNFLVSYKGKCSVNFENISCFSVPVSSVPFVQCNHSQCRNTLPQSPHTLVYNLEIAFFPFSIWKI